MFIGGSPGSTAGGIKTTTVALVYYYVSVTRGRQETEVLKDVLIKMLSIEH